MVARQEKSQKDHYDRIASEYEAHYDDRFSRVYRNSFLHDPIFEGLDMKDCKVLEGMCGSGQATQYLIDLGAEVVGLDISEEVIVSFKKRWPQAKALRASIFDSNLEDKSFDMIVVFGGLHHVHPRLQEAIDEIHRLLKDGGYFCFGEPHAGCLPDFFRKLWYRFDIKMFAEGEAAIDLEQCKKENSSRFRFLKEKYIGNLAYLFVFNSMIFRVPLSWKKIYSRCFMTLESLIEPFQGKFFSCYSLSQWQKLPRNKKQSLKQ
jgi:SAM-dependent methyltransferase